VSIKFFRIQGSNCIGVSVTSITEMIKESLSKITQQFQKTLINAISHERLTPLNAIINCCESVSKRLKPKTVRGGHHTFSEE
jgi:signal transduction histidine kinase